MCGDATASVVKFNIISISEHPLLLMNMMIEFIYMNFANL